MDQKAGRRNGSAIAPGPRVLFPGAHPNGLPWLAGQADAESSFRRGIVHDPEVPAKIIIA